MTATATRGAPDTTASAALPTVPLLISGAWIESQAQQWRNVVNPATGEPLARVPCTTAEELGAAVEAARDAFPGWRQTPGAERAAVLRRYQALIRAALPALVGQLVAERGKTRADAGDELLRTVEAVGLAARIAAVEMAEQTCTQAAGVGTRSRLEPLGVCAGITPFDDPALLPVSMFAITLAAGNSFVLKPSRQVPLTTMQLVELAVEAGVPPGVLNVVHGGDIIVNGLCDHPDIQALAFAGSATVASRVQRRAQLAGKRVYCDPGRPNLAIVLPDAARGPTLDSLVAEAFGGAGQRSTAVGTVLLVGETRAWLPDLVARAAALRIGGGEQADADLGPLVSAVARVRIERLIAGAIDRGATALLDGRGCSGPTLAGGQFLGPTILAGGGPRLGREAVHGPVLQVHEVPTLDAALRLVTGQADAMPGGVCLYTGSRAAARRFAETVEAGALAINAPLAAAVPLPAADGQSPTDLPPCIRAAIGFCTRAGSVTERWFD